MGPAGFEKKPERNRYATAKPMAPAVKPGTAFIGRTSFAARGFLVSAHAIPAAANARTAVSFVAIIRPADPPAPASQPSFGDRVYRHAQPIIPSVKNTRSISCI